MKVFEFNLETSFGSKDVSRMSLQLDESDHLAHKYSFSSAVKLRDYIHRSDRCTLEILHLGWKIYTSHRGTNNQKMF